MQWALVLDLLSGISREVVKKKDLASEGLDFQPELSARVWWADSVSGLTKLREEDPLPCGFEGTKLVTVCE